MNLLEQHEKVIARPKLKFLTKNIYIPKLMTKFTAPYMYHPKENDENMHVKETNNFLFGNQKNKEVKGTTYL